MWVGTIMGTPEQSCDGWPADRAVMGDAQGQGGLPPGRNTEAGACWVGRVGWEERPQQRELHVGRAQRKPRLPVMRNKNFSETEWWLWVVGIIWGQTGGMGRSFETFV